MFTSLTTRAKTAIYTAIDRARPAATLPDKPSALIRVAMADLKKCERDPRYFVDMAQWHEFNESKNACAVCFAGAVMAKSLKVSEPLVEGNYADPYKFGTTVQHKMQALNQFRAGEIEDALERLRIVRPAELPRCINVARYEQEPVHFHRQMEAMAVLLEGHGL